MSLTLTITDTDVVGAAESMLPGLRARAQETENLRRLPDETITEAVDSGLLAMLAPKRYGGHELGLRAFVDVTRTLARACPSSAWTLSFLIEHSWMTARFPEQVQTEMFGDKPYALMASSGNGLPDNHIEKVDGGYRVTGSWSFASGVMHSDWAVLSPILDGTQLFCAVPLDDVEVLDVWHMSGMRGTGSNTVRIVDLFVPEHRVFDIKHTFSADSAGVALHPDYDFLRYEFTSLTNLGLAPIAIGAAEGAVEAFGAAMHRRRVRAFGGRRHVLQVESPGHVAAFGRARTKLHIAQVLLESALERTIAAYRTAAVLTDEDRVLLRSDMANAAHMAAEVIEIVARAMGGGVYSESNPIQRFRRDVDVLLGHHINDLLFVDDGAGRVLLGLASADGEF